MGASQIPASSGGGTADNYVLISSVTPTAAASTVSFTGISGYRKLMLRHVATTLATAGNLTVTFNSDTGTNYAYAKIEGTTTMDNKQTQIETKIALGTTNVAAQLGATYIIDGVAGSGPKPFTGFGNTSSTTVASINGVYVASAAITTVTLTASTTFSGVGTVALYGVLS